MAYSNHHSYKEIGRVNRNLSSEVQHYYHVDLPMLTSASFVCSYTDQLVAKGGTEMVANIRWSHFCVSLVLLPGLWHRRNCLVEKQFVVGSLVPHLTLERPQQPSR